MISELEIPISDFAMAISDAVDMAIPALSHHHKKVAYISYSISHEMDLPHAETQDIVLAALLHDIGAFTTKDRMKIVEIEVFDTEYDQHSLLGYKLIKDFEPLANAALLIRHHHANYSRMRDDIPLGSHVIHLADRASVWFDERFLNNRKDPKAFDKIARNANSFHPDVLAAFRRLMDSECFLIEAFLTSPSDALMRRMRFTKEIVDLETLKSFAMMIAQIIDFRSRFTATHSSGVAAVARELSILEGFSERECQLMEIAGLLHDLGKLVVPNEILEKNGPLTDEEFNTVKRHTYFTYSVLSGISGLEQIATWAAYHHERQDGSGYPFMVKKEDFCRLARIMAVADILTALTEDRPYRLGMSREKASSILNEKAANGYIDKSIVDKANDNFFRVNNARIKAQQKAQKEYEEFYLTKNLIDQNESKVYLALTSA